MARPISRLSTRKHNHSTRYSLATNAMCAVFPCRRFQVYYNADMEMVLDKKQIRRRYMRGWFALDLFASLPYDIVEYALIGNSEVRWAVETS
jgi:hypothetical protein